MSVSSADARSVSTPKVIRRQDYAPPAFTIETVELEIDLAAEATRVRSHLTVTRRRAGEPLVLDGQGMKLLSVTLDGRPLSGADYTVDSEKLCIPNAPADFVLAIETLISPITNTALEGLYLSRGLYATQCEAEGFRRITYFIDRPDVMARYTVRIIADRTTCPVLLSNGNLIETGLLDDNKHYAVWQDPFPKPSYLFALVAGDLGHMEDKFTTASGREVTLRIYAAKRDLDKCDHAMESLKASMRWDEAVYGLEYDLDIFNIVAVSDFNMGAMENKSLNIFNTKCVLAKAETATDADFAAVQGVIAHEYFHNWTGNRVTCRDWFQLSLKEGLTVFRDQQFSADHGSAAVKRIDDVRLLRAHQFPEDAGPMAHPVRPDSYIEINNFYTPTVYEKGAEVIRMLRRLLGAEGFYKGMDLYFARHDGQAVTCDDFVAAMEDATGIDLQQFRRWYAQAGTPVVDASWQYDAERRTLALTLSQSTPPTPGQRDKEPLHIPVAVGLLGHNGRPLSYTVASNEKHEPDANGTVVLNFREAVETFYFQDVREVPVPSILRDFSAPVRLQAPLNRHALRFLMAHDADAFNRWEAAQKLAKEIILGLVDARRAGQGMAIDSADIDAFRATLQDHTADPALIAEALTVPSEGDLALDMAVVDVEGIHEARKFVRAELARSLREEWRAVYRAHLRPGPYRFNAADVAARRLKNLALSYLMADAEASEVALALDQFNDADNMTDEFAALREIVHLGASEAAAALNRFYVRWREEDLVIDKWFSVQATTPSPHTVAAVNALARHRDFNLKNPNRARALIGAFTQFNPIAFHDATGDGYRFLRQQVVALEKFNPVVAARLLHPLGRWQRYDHKRQALMKAELEIILGIKGLSRDVFEVAAKSMGRA
jgi:aminopeptidase N